MAWLPPLGQSHATATFKSGRNRLPAHQPREPRYTLPVIAPAARTPAGRPPRVPAPPVHPHSPPAAWSVRASPPSGSRASIRPALATRCLSSHCRARSPASHE
jgi:hypothetical protein